MSKKQNIFWNVILLIVISGLISFQGISAAGNDQPRVMVTSYELKEGGIIPGETGELTLTLKNMNTRYAVYSVLVTCQSSELALSTEYRTSNQGYIETIQPGEEKQITLSLQADDTLITEGVRCSLNISYVSDARGSSSVDTLIYLPVKQDYLKIQRAYIPQTAVVNVNSRISITCENMISEEIYNGVMTVKGSGMKDASVALGTVLSGSRKNQEVYIAFDSLGEQSVLVELSYEDAKGNSYTTKTQSYQVEVESSETDNTEVEAGQEQTSGIQTSRVKQAGCALGILLCGFGIAIVTFRQRRI